MTSPASTSNPVLDRRRSRRIAPSTWLPDGHTIAFSAAMPKGKTSAPVWSPDGHHLLVNAVLGGRGGLWTTSPTGARRHFVVFAGSGDWQPRAG